MARERHRAMQMLGVIINNSTNNLLSAAAPFPPPPLELFGAQQVMLEPPRVLRGSGAGRARVALQI